MGTLANLDVLKILGYGLSGLGFLLMYLAYRLLDKLSDKEKPSQSIISSINRFIVICLLMTIVVGSFTYMTRDFKNTELAAKDTTIQNKTAALKVLSTAKKISDLTDSIKNYANGADDHKKIQFAKEQKSTLDTLSKYIAKDHNPVALAKFNRYKAYITTFPVKTANNVNKPSETDLVTYRKFTDSISKISSTFAIKKAKD
jgi:hypothetical protein